MRRLTFENQVRGQRKNQEIPRNAVLMMKASGPGRSPQSKLLLGQRAGVPLTQRGMTGLTNRWI